MVDISLGPRLPIFMLRLQRRHGGGGGIEDTFEQLDTASTDIVGVISQLFSEMQNRV
jgi:hypothetical protein